MHKDGFGSYHPLPCFLYYAGLFALSALLYHPVLLSAALALILAVNLFQDRGRSLRQYSRLYLLMAGLLILLNPVISHRGATVLLSV